jgi:hypothetical protein
MAVRARRSAPPLDLITRVEGVKTTPRGPARDEHAGDSPEHLPDDVDFNAPTVPKVWRDAPAPRAVIKAMPADVEPMAWIPPLQIDVPPFPPCTIETPLVMLSEPEPKQTRLVAPVAPMTPLWSREPVAFRPSGPVPVVVAAHSASSPLHRAAVIVSCALLAAAAIIVVRPRIHALGGSQAAPPATFAIAPVEPPTPAALAPAPTAVADVPTPAPPPTMTSTPRVDPPPRRKTRPASRGSMPVRRDP